MNPIVRLCGENASLQRTAYVVFIFTIASPVLMYWVFLEYGIQGIITFLWLSWWGTSAFVLDHAARGFRSRFKGGVEQSGNWSVFFFSLVIHAYPLGPWLIILGLFNVIFRFAYWVTSIFADKR